MPLLPIIRPQSGLTIFLWDLQESTEALKRLLPGTSNIAYDTIRSERRQRERLAVDLLLREAGISSVSYDAAGRPWSRDGRFISISHSNNYVCLAVHATMQVGIDIECLGMRVMKVSSRFLNEQELNTLSLHDDKVMHLCWCAKEALYKIFGASLVDFRASICVHPFQLSDTGKGSFSADLVPLHKTVDVHYIHTDTYVCAFALYPAVL